MRTQGVFQQDTAFPDGQIFVQINPGDATSGTVSLASAGAGLVTTHIGNSQTVVFRKSLNSLLFRYGVQDYAQEQWGSTANGGANFKATPPAVFTTPYGVSGNPPFTGSSQLVPPTSRPKGIQINTAAPIYSIGSADASLNTLGITQTFFANATAPAVTTILTNAAHSMSVTHATNPYLPTIAVNSGMLTSTNAQYIVEWDITTPSGGTADVYGLLLFVSYNFN